ncbi:hypothetical protein FBY35_3756 [Streptomyces sp. SLBN-118]|uniref:hypothetical protein n=1 Tax=Streptomyces sp. SLBN-118 TaxID=2768454 RepID=UPI00114E7B22|nr:hypothetical protein [Streptomyces sp. SLBN-118]TQK42362.1 hypothetical protein FBY35_3756 [Streptomyces sp. SLBN-118]
MPVYLTRRDADTHVQELEAPAVSDAADRAAFDSAHLARPATAAATELAELARDLADAGVTVQWHPDGLVLRDFASGPGDTAGIRVRTTRRAPHPAPLYVVTAVALVPLTHAAGVLAYLKTLIDAAARGCEGCRAEPGEPCLPNCLPAPSTT